MQPGTLEYSKKSERKISAFVGHELLYDYVTGRLDPERLQAVEEFLKLSREAQSDVQRINNGLNYVMALSETQLTSSVLAEIKAPSSYFQVLLRKLRFEEWSPGIKMGLEVLVVAVGVISACLLIPWHRMLEINWIGNREVILAEVASEEPGSRMEDVETPNAQTDGTEVFPDDVAVQKARQQSLDKITTATQVKLAAPVAVESSKPVEPESVPVKKTETKPTEAKPPEAKVADSTNRTKGEAHVGMLYRGSILVTGAPVVSQKFADKIHELGGRKAGEVELGWQKGTSRYFHFTIPESKLATLQEFAQDYGALSLSKEKHDRVMPEGIVRIIFTVDEKK